MSLLFILSILYFISFSTYIIWGGYILFLNTKSKLNKLFFAICLMLSVWALSFSMCNSTTDYEVALIWRRIASFGWVTLFGLLIHFFIILTEKEIILKKSRWLYLIIYLPVIVFNFIFSLSEYAKQEYSFEYTELGWINIADNTIWDHLFECYFITISIIGIRYLLQWGKNTKDYKKKKQAYVIIASYIFSMIIGIATDLLINIYTSLQCPQLAPITGIIPITAIYYATKRYDLMISENNVKTEPGKILNEKNRVKIYQAMSMVFIVGAFLNHITQFYINHEPIIPVFTFSMLLFCMGVILQFIQRASINEAVKNVLFSALILLVIPILTVQYLEYAGVTVWAVSFLFIIISVVFNNRHLMIGLVVSTVLTQIYTWIQKPDIMVHVNETDYIVRIVFIILAIWIAVYVNQIYLKRLKENEEQIMFQNMVSSISTDFIGVNENNIDEKINMFLKLSGAYFKVDRAYVISLSQNLKTYEWYKEGLESAIYHIPIVTNENFPWLNEKIHNHCVVSIPNVDQMPKEAEKEKIKLKSHNIKSMIVFPLIRKEKVLGFLFFTSINEYKDFDNNYVELLRILANILSDGLIKVEAEKEISYMAFYDTLTGVPNRALFVNRLEHAILLAKKSKTLIGVIFIDLDSFKAINDTIGHYGGNEMLIMVAKRISGCLRKQDTVARFGGDEFLIQVTDITKVEEIIEIAERILKAIAMPITIKEQEFFVTASIGISIYPIDGTDTEVLIKYADMAMYTSKYNGRHQYTLCSDKMKDELLRKTKLTTHLYKALAKNEFILYYQPQICTLTNKIIGVEALIRWINAEFGMISPNVFIPLAEQTGLIDAIGEWVLETACKQMKQWQEAGLPDIRMAVNLSADQFGDRNLIRTVNQVLYSTKLEADYLILEITERTAVEKENLAIQMMNELKTLGVSISIDDFGEEYSSLGRLKSYPIDQLKIDKKFIQNISEGKKDKAIVKTIIQLAKNLELNVIAEGVETKEQYEFLRNEDCDEIQGYYFYKPMPASEFEALLSKQLNKKLLRVENH